LLEGFPLEDGEGLIDIDSVAHAVEDGCHARFTVLLSNVDRGFYLSIGFSKWFAIE